MSREPDQHEQSLGDAQDKSFDVAQQSLSDALRSSFGVLKWIMGVLFVLYLGSNVRSIDTHEEGLILRFGKLVRVVSKPGLVWAFPYPIDEIVPLPTRQSNELRIDSHTFKRRPDEIGRPLSAITRSFGGGLNPAVDGALLTADAGLVHTQWKVTYKFDDLRSFVTDIAGDQIAAAEKLIRTFIETVGIEVASELTAEEMIRTRVDYVQLEMKDRTNERLAEAGSGIKVALVEMFEPTPPLQVRRSFDNTQRSENRKRQLIRAADKKRTQILSTTAGSAYPRLVRLIEKAGYNSSVLPDDIRDRMDRILETDVEGEAGRRIKEAGAYRATVVSKMQSDVERYRTLLPEYKRNPIMLISRLWEQTKQQIFNSPGVTKVYRPSGIKEYRLLIPLDPEESRLQEQRKLQKKGFDIRTIRPERLVPIGPEAD